MRDVENVLALPASASGIGILPPLFKIIGYNLLSSIASMFSMISRHD
jgi:hypothetical protein